MKDKTKKILNNISWAIIVLPLILALLLPMPYDGINPVVFMFKGEINISTLILFIFLMITISLSGIMLNKFTTIITDEKVMSTMTTWMREKNLEKMHGVIPTMISIVKENKELNKLEAKQKQREYIEMLQKTWNVEKKLNIEQDEFIKKELEELERLRRENKELEEFKLEKERIEEEIRNERLGE